MSDLLPDAVERWPLPLIERAVLQAWELGLPYVVIPREHLLAVTMQGEEPVMPPGVCGWRHEHYSLDVTFFCLRSVDDVCVVPTADGVYAYHRSEWPNRVPEPDEPHGHGWGGVHHHEGMTL